MTVKQPTADSSAVAPVEGWRSRARGGDRLQDLIHAAFPAGENAARRVGRTDALIVIQRGQIVCEEYADGVGPATISPSWSIAKSITHALIGLLVQDGKLDIFAPADVPAWRRPGDPRGRITPDHLLRMSSGLGFVEEYAQDKPSDTREMLRGRGAEDMAAFAASFPLEHRPGTAWSYSSGSTLILCGIAARAADAFGDDFRRFMFSRLFEPLGMANVAPRFDVAGTFVGSAHCDAAARDFARFGLLYLHGGCKDSRRLLPTGWVEQARTPRGPQPYGGEGYGAHWWLGMMGPGSFSANGYKGQYVVVEPALDLVVVRLGDTPPELEAPQKDWMRAVVNCFR